MTAITLDGKLVRDEIFTDLRVRVAALRERGVVPGLATVIVGDDPGSHAYVRGKHSDCAKVGIVSIRRDLPASATQAELLDVVDELNADPACTGYIVQLPLPSGLDTGVVLERMDPDKDADGLHPVSLGRLVLGEPGPLPCTPRGIVELLRRFDVPLAGANVTVIGRGLTVGRPLGLLLTRRSENATATLCHTATKDIAAEVARAGLDHLGGDQTRPAGGGDHDVGARHLGGEVLGSGVAQRHGGVLAAPGEQQAQRPAHGDAAADHGHVRAGQRHVEAAQQLDDPARRARQLSLIHISEPTRPY